MKILILAFCLTIIFGNISCKVYNNENIDLTEETVGDENHGTSYFDIPSEISLSRYKREESPSLIETIYSLITNVISSIIRYIPSFSSIIFSIISSIRSVSIMISDLVFKIIFPTIIEGLKFGANFGVVSQDAINIVSFIFDMIEQGYKVYLWILSTLIDMFSSL